MRNNFLLLLILGFVVSVGCRSSKPLIMESESPSSESSSVIEYLIKEKERPFFESVRGKARSILNSNGNSERFIIEFEADKDHSVLKLKNSLGIHAATLIVTPDSIFEINHIEKQVVQSTRTLYSVRATGVEYPLHIYPILKPVLFIDQPKTAHFVDDLWEVSAADDMTFFLTKDFVVQELLHSQKNRSSFERIHFSSYGLMEGMRVPRKITLTHEKTGSQLLLMIVSLKTLSERRISLPEIPTHYSLVYL